MTDDSGLADRIRGLLAPERGLTETHRSGSLMFEIDGSAAVTLSALGGIVVRVPASGTRSFIDETYVRAVEMDGFRIEGWVRVHPDVLITSESLQAWVTRSVELTRSLDPGGTSLS